MDGTRTTLQLRPVRFSGGRAFDVIDPDGDCLGTVTRDGEGWAAVLPRGSGTVRLPGVYNRRRAAVGAVWDAHRPE